MSQTTNALVKTNLNELGRLLVESVNKELLAEGSPILVDTHEFANLLRERMEDATISFQVKDGVISQTYLNNLAKLVVFIASFFAKEGLDLDQKLDKILKIALES